MVILKQIFSFALGIRIFDDDVRSTDAIEAAALLHKINVVDIYSNSWGQGDAGWEIEEPGVLTSRALKLGTEQVKSPFFHFY